MPPKGPKYPPPKVEEETDSDEEIEDDDEEDEEVDVTEFLNNMTVHQRRKVYALKGLQADFRSIRKRFLDELAAAELEFMASTAPLREERRKIVAGERDVTAEELKKYQEVSKESTVEELPSDEEEGAEDAKKKQKKGVKVVSVDDERAKGALDEAATKADGGIPSFWLTALQNNEVLEGMMTERDVPALQHLIDISKDYVDNNPRVGFTISFHFSENDYFTNTVLTKKYLYDKDPEAADDDSPMLETIEGCEIDWKSQEKKLTVVLKQKKQRHKSGKGIRVVTREERCPSFFHFFTAPKAPESEQDDDEAEEEMDYDEQMEMDYEAATMLADFVIPRAAHYYSGRSVEEIAATMDLDALMGGLGGMGDDDEEDEEESEEEEEQAPRGRGGRGGQQGGGRGGRGGRGGQAGGPECKQQ